VDFNTASIVNYQSPTKNDLEKNKKLEMTSWITKQTKTIMRTRVFRKRRFRFNPDTFVFSVYATLFQIYYNYSKPSSFYLRSLKLNELTKTTNIRLPKTPIFAKNAHLKFFFMVCNAKKWLNTKDMLKSNVVSFNDMVINIYIIYK